MDGEGISGNATNGWTLILALIVTPVLMVIGFLIGMGVFRVTSVLLLSGIFPVFHASLSTASTLTILLALPAVMIVVGVMQLILIERSFSLVTEFPSRVLAWIGGRADLADQGALERARIGMVGATAGIGTLGPGAAQQAGMLGRRGGGYLARQGRRLLGGRDSATPGPGNDKPTGD